ncbi:MAG: acetyl-CoA C-acyltransferase [Bacteroidia bacterium]
MYNAFIIDGIRTPIGNFTGSLSSVRTDDLAALVIRELMQRNNSVDPEAIDDVILGCANQAGEDNRNVARMALLLAGLPFKVPGETVNRLCASGMGAAVNAARAATSNDGDIFIAGGVENMTRGPWVISKTSQPYGRDAHMFDSSFGWRFINPKMKELFGVESMGETAENLVDKFGLTREQQDEFAFCSQHKAANALEDKRFVEEIIPVQIPKRKGDPLIFDEDEFIRKDTSVEVLSTLKPAFKKNGSVTAGNSSGLNDGAVALLIASESGIGGFNLKPLARIVSSAVSGVEPRIMGLGPVEASQKALKKAGLTYNDIDIIEINEAFAAQVLACLKEMKIDFDDDRINPNGGAIALGHPLGMTGARLLQTAAIELQKSNKKFALCTLCVGVGQGYATILEKV